MKELLTYIVQSLVDEPDQVSVTERKTDGETVIKGSDDLCMWLLYNAHVACVAGNAFGNDDCIRLSYATSEDKLIEAVKRIKTALTKLH